MRMNWAFAFLLAALVGSLASEVARTQTTAGQSNYIFRYNTGISGVFLDTMTFSSERPLDLGSCTTSEKVNGPIACAVNCESESVCLLEVSGPAGAGVDDVMELASETPLTGATPSPTGSPDAGSPNTRSEMGRWFPGSAGEAASQESRVAAYNAP